VKRTEHVTGFFNLLNGIANFGNVTFRHSFSYTWPVMLC